MGTSTENEKYFPSQEKETFRWKKLRNVYEGAGKASEKMGEENGMEYLTGDASSSKWSDDKEESKQRNKKRNNNKRKRHGNQEDSDQNHDGMTKTT